jgi:hypothetical protein
MANHDALLACCKDTGKTKLFIVLKSFRLIKIALAKYTARLTDRLLAIFVHNRLLCNVNMTRTEDREIMTMRLAMDEIRNILCK